MQFWWNQLLQWTSKINSEFNKYCFWEKIINQTVRENLINRTVKTTIWKLIHLNYMWTKKILCENRDNLAFRVKPNTFRSIWKCHKNLITKRKLKNKKQIFWHLNFVPSRLSKEQIVKTRNFRFVFVLRIVQNEKLNKWNC